MRGADVNVDLERSGALAATWVLPAHALGVVLFAHAGGGGRANPRTWAVAEALERRRFATLVLELLTPDEEEADDVEERHRFDIPLLARRIFAGMDWVARSTVSGLPLGLVGSQTVAAALLVAAAERPGDVRALVLRAGRCDLAGAVLSRVHAPTLLIVGGRDDLFLELNERACIELGGTRELVVVPNATHSFLEQGALDVVVDATRSWFEVYLRPEPGVGAGARV